MHIENTEHAETNSESHRRQNTKKLIIESFQKRDGLIFTSERTSLELDVEVFKKNYLTIIKKIQENI